DLINVRLGSNAPSWAVLFTQPPDCLVIRLQSESCLGRMQVRASHACMAPGRLAKTMATLVNPIDADLPFRSPGNAESRAVTHGPGESIWRVVQDRVLPGS